MIRVAVHTAAVHTAAIHAAGGPAINSTGILAWFVKYVIPLLFLVIGGGIVARANKGETGHNATVIANSILGIGVIAFGAVAFVFGGSLVNLFFGK